MARTAQTRDHLGVGWAFPVRPKNGRLRFARYEEDIEQAIGIILETARRERLMRPDFGADLRSYVFAPNAPHIHRRIENEVRAALRDWEPRIRVERVTATADADQQNLLLIAIDYVVKRTNAAFNRVYPFYLNEGA